MKISFYFLRCHNSNYFNNNLSCWMFTFQSRSFDSDDIPPSVPTFAYGPDFCCSRQCPSVLSSTQTRTVWLWMPDPLKNNTDASQRPGTAIPWLPPCWEILSQPLSSSWPPPAAMRNNKYLYIYIYDILISHIVNVAADRFEVLHNIIERLRDTLLFNVT